MITIQKCSLTLFIFPFSFLSFFFFVFAGAGSYEVFCGSMAVFEKINYKALKNVFFFFALMINY